MPMQMYFLFFTFYLISNLIISNNCTAYKYDARDKSKDTREEVRYARRVKDKKSKSKGEKQGKQAKQTHNINSLSFTNVGAVIKGSKKGSTNVYVVDNNGGNIVVVAGGKGGVKGKEKGSKQKSTQIQATSSKSGRGVRKRCLIAAMSPLSPNPPSAPSPVAPTPTTNSAPSPPTASYITGSIAICKVRQNGYFAGFNVVINVCGIGTTCTDATVASVSTRKCAALILNTNTCSNISNNAATLVNVGFYLESPGIPYSTWGGCSISQGNMWNGYRLRDNRNYAIVVYDSNSQPIACGILDWKWVY